MNSQQPNQSYAASLPTSTLAIISLVAGILGLSGLLGIGSIIALITGMMARNETRGNPPTHSGDGMATAGIVMGWIGIGLSICGLCVFAGLFIVPLFLTFIGVAVGQSALPLMQLMF